MLSSLWTWISPASSSSGPAAPDRPNSNRQPGPSSPTTATASVEATSPSSEGGGAAVSAAPSKKNRKKREQRKKKKRQSTVPLTTATTTTDDDEHDDEDQTGPRQEREPDEMLQEDEDAARRRKLEEEAFPDADDDTAYLDRLCALDADEGRTGSTSVETAGGGAPSSGTLASSANLLASSAAPTPSTLDATPTTTTVPPESLAVDDLVASMLAQGKTHPGPTGPLQRVHNLPEGAGQAPGLPLVKSTAESRRKAVEHGLVPITDEQGTLRVGFRIRDDIVLMHPKDLKGEPVLLRM